MARNVAHPMRREPAEKSYEQLSAIEKARILVLTKDNLSATAIAGILDRQPSTVWRFLRKYESTVGIARAHFEAKADELAVRITKYADVDQALEVEDRLGVLPKVREQLPGMQFNVMVGTGSAGGVPVPTEAEVSAAQQLKE